MNKIAVLYLARINKGLHDFENLPGPIVIIPRESA